jgi:hypothetical protein
MSLGRIINLRDWKNNKSGRWRERHREKRKKEREHYSCPQDAVLFVLYGTILLATATLELLLHNQLERIRSETALRTS